MEDTYPVKTQPGVSPFDRIRQWEDGHEFWSARDLQELMGYEQWRNFEEAIERAKLACQNSGLKPEHHFADASKDALENKGIFADASKDGQRKSYTVKDYRLTRYACYLVAMNSDPRKQEVSRAQTYFAQKTREAELLTPGLAATDPLVRLEAQHQEVTHAIRQLGITYRQLHRILIHSDLSEKQLTAPREMPRSQMMMLDALRGKRLTYSQWVAAGMQTGELAERTAKDAIGRLKQQERMSQIGKYYFIPEEKEVITTHNSTE